ncbi:hypothetical protein J6590_061838 [Homalodisca vitripennis]|nr:hypothetical protein J6590_061838 [Homalodisca vitripennis]
MMEQKCATEDMCCAPSPVIWVQGQVTRREDTVSAPHTLGSPSADRCGVEMYSQLYRSAVAVQ